MSESMIRKRAMAQHLSRAEPPSKSHFRVCNVREIRFKMVCNAEARNLFHFRKGAEFFWGPKRYSEGLRIFNKKILLSWCDWRRCRRLGDVERRSTIDYGLLLKDKGFFYFELLWRSQIPSLVMHHYKKDVGVQSWIAKLWKAQTSQ